MDQLGQRLNNLNREYSLKADERMSLLEQIDEFKTRLHKLQLERDAACREKSKEVSGRPFSP